MFILIFGHLDTQILAKKKQWMNLCDVNPIAAPIEHYRSNKMIIMFKQQNARTQTYLRITISDDIVDIVNKFEYLE